MAHQKKISFATKLLSNHRFLNEVPVEGKKSPTFHFHLSNYDLYASQIIRTGNCITLLSTPINITDVSFWNTNHFEDLVKYVFWTFNRSFLLKLLDQLEVQPPAVLQRCRELLLENPVAYPEPIPEDADEELQFCYMKNGNLKKDTKYQLMFSLDEQNRKAILNAVEKRMAGFSRTPSPSEPFQGSSVVLEDFLTKDKNTPTLDFLSLVRPMNGSLEKTLQFISAQVESAGFEFPLFTPVKRLANGKNPYGFNGAMAAMIHHFHELHYFEKKYSFIEIFNAYLDYSQNSVGKLRVFLATYRQDRHFLKYLSNLKDLKISKLP